MTTLVHAVTEVTTNLAGLVPFTMRYVNSDKWHSAADKGLTFAY